MTPTPLSLIILGRPDHQLEIRLEGAPLVVGLAPAPEHALLDDLHSQVAAGQAPPAAVGALADLLGQLLFVEPVGEALRRALDERPDALLSLAADDAHARWPWELARDPVTGRQPVLEGAGMIRAAGAPAPERRFGARGVMVVPEARGRARQEALDSATRHLARKCGIEVFAAEAPSGPGLRQQLASGAALVHLDVDSRGGAVDLQDGLVPVDRLGLDGRTWLVILGGHETTKDAALALREAGVPLVLGRQMELKLHETGAIDRELYRALAGGASPIEAVRRVRRALSRQSGRAEGRWASLVLWAAPPIPGLGGSEADRPFPPPLQAGGGLLDLSGPGLGDLGHPTLPGGIPVAAARFVQQTIRRLRDADAADGDPALTARAAALRSLGAKLTTEAEGEGLPQDERVRHLADRFIEGLGHPDADLARPADLGDRLGSAARQAGLAREDLARASAGLLACRIIGLRGRAGASPLAAAQALTEGGFGYWLQVAAPGATPLVGSPIRPGWLQATATLGWRQDELDLEHPDLAPPRTRMPVVVRRPGGWSHHPGAWLAVSGAAPELSALLAAVRQGALEDLTERGRPWRLALPADLRLLILDPPSELPGVPVFDIHPGAAADELSRSLAVAQARLGPAEDPPALGARHALAEGLVAAARLLRAFLPVPFETVDAAVCYAIERGGPREAATDDALCVFLGEPLAALREGSRAALRAWLAGQPGQALARLLKPDAAGPADRGILIRLGQHLDQDAPTGTPRITDPVALATLDEGRLVVQIGAWTQSGGLAAPAPCPQLQARLR